MKRILGALALGSALVAAGALAENTSSEQRAALAKLWGRDVAAGAGPTAAARQNFTGIGEQRRDHLSGHWATNFRGGRKHPPAGH